MSDRCAEIMKRVESVKCVDCACSQGTIVLMVQGQRHSMRVPREPSTITLACAGRKSVYPAQVHVTLASFTFIS